MEKQITLGFAPTQRAIFDKTEALKIKKTIEDKIRTYDVRIETLEGITGDGLLNRPLDADKVAGAFVDKGVDAVFFPHCDFGEEAAIARVGKKLGKPVLMWAPRDEAPRADGSRQRDSQCGIFASTKVMQMYGVPFSYITNSSVNDEIFDRGFRNFLAAAHIVKEFRRLRIGQISTRPAPFCSVMANEAELLEKFGVEVVPTTLVDIEQSVKSILKRRPESLMETAMGIKAKIPVVKVDDEAVERLAALKLAIKSWAEQEQLSAAGIQCWSALQASLGIVPCFINGELTAEGLPVVCETDIFGAITSVMMQAAVHGKETVFFADLTIRHPENDNAELLWHCGVFPSSLGRDKASMRLDATAGVYPGCGNWEIKGGDITIGRLGGAGGDYSFLVGHGKAVAGPYNSGTYLWAEFNDWPLWEHKFIYGPYIHHCTGVHGKIAPALYEACRYIDGLKPDPVDPDEGTILKYLRG
jgi:L-fucose isomerase-like protein